MSSSPFKSIFNFFATQEKKVEPEPIKKTINKKILNEQSDIIRSEADTDTKASAIAESEAKAAIIRKAALDMALAKVSAEIKAVQEQKQKPESESESEEEIDNPIEETETETETKDIASHKREANAISIPSDPIWEQSLLAKASDVECPNTDIVWKSDLPIPTHKFEFQLLNYIFGSNRLAWNELAQNMPLEYADLPDTRQEYIRIKAHQLGFELGQAISLRRHVLHKIAGHLFKGTQEETLKKADKCEQDIADYLKSQNIGFFTQNDLTKLHEDAKVRCRVTPDFLLHGKVIINNKPVRWLEVKNYYGSNCKYIPIWLKNQAVDQARKYTEAFGPGAILFKYGCSAEMRELFSNDVLILDSSPIMNFEYMKGTSNPSPFSPTVSSHPRPYPQPHPQPQPLPRDQI